MKQTYFSKIRIWQINPKSGEYQIIVITEGDFRLKGKYEIKYLAEKIGN